MWVPGLESSLCSPVGLKVFAAGFGLNAIAFALNRAEVAEVGVRIWLDACGLVIGRGLATGLEGKFRGF